MRVLWASMTGRRVSAASAAVPKASATDLPLALPWVLNTRIASEKEPSIVTFQLILG